MAHLKSLAEETPAVDPWLWPQRVALGSLTLVVGDPGIGKSYLTHDMAARVSRGALWPEEELAAGSAGQSFKAVTYSTNSLATFSSGN